MTNQLLKEWSDANPDCTIHSLDTDETMYNGWTNYETWNVALYINNEYAIYKKAYDWVLDQKHCDLKVSYNAFIPVLEQYFSKITPDGVSWMEPLINSAELDEMLDELVEG